MLVPIRPRGRNTCGARSSYGDSTLYYAAGWEWVVPPGGEPAAKRSGEVG